MTFLKYVNLKYVNVSAFLLLLMATAPIAHAGLMKFTYTSKPLPIQSAFMEGYPDSSVDLNDWVAPSFTLTFTAPEQDLTLKKNTSFFMGDAQLTMQENFILNNVHIRPQSYGRVSLDADGQVTGWNLILFLTEFIPHDATHFDKYLLQLASARFDIVSRYGSGTCNCDSIRESFHPVYYSPRSNTYTRLVNLERYYGDINETNQWQVDRIAVPEPHSIGLIALALSALFIRRRASLLTAVSGRVKKHPPIVS